mmetsp:Transcript_58720/g.179116  ORF Transcript_58720/g.179116 Transcript_58720/m.179116 type:complete len:225 (-) Transcript_58720:1000-1674(-)
MHRDVLMDDVLGLLPCHPLPADRRRHALVVVHDGRKVCTRQILDLDLHCINMVHRQEVFESGRLFDVVSVVGEADPPHLERGQIVLDRALRQIAVVQADVHFGEVGQLLRDDVTCSSLELLFVEGQGVGFELLGQEAVGFADEPRRRLLPSLKQKLVLLFSVGRSHLQLQNVHHAHQKWHAVVAPPHLELRLVLLELAPQLVYRVPSFGTPHIEVEVELLQPVP